MTHELLKWLGRRSWGICLVTINEGNHVWHRGGTMAFAERRLFTGER